MVEQIQYPCYQQIPANYSGVTINITNPSLGLNTGSCQPAQATQNVTAQPSIQVNGNDAGSGLPQSYPAQYYLNNYNYQNPDNQQQNENGADTSKVIINNLNEEQNKRKELEKNGKQQRVVSLTNEYIQSLENYLNNPNQEVRLMAAKEVLTRLDEDKTRYDDAALNALVNKMLQDPDKLIRVAAMSALSSQLASGNEYTVQLLKQIQSDVNSNKEDVVEASNILLNMTAQTEVKYVQQPVKQQEQTSEASTVKQQVIQNR